ncbi:anti-sigma factor [Hymenobacter sp. ASUV-10]|uniref:Regulator of SigK n=1 Tax=Hymenobacter aranciens TaxID=3063996 RepID=A0ABT9BCB4_9BACT|nr:anti-sigma factor [Hymenobacter sp. ASUV-10]MDO7875902.1 anti-sigma factor [Hymenobacter sp. ASUV-10]
MQDIQAYIESGILELYALGDLSSAERAEVEAQAARHPAVRQELTQVQAALGLYAEAHAITPPAGMRERVLGHVLANLNSPVAETPATPASRPATSSLRADVDELVQSRHAETTTSTPVLPLNAPEPVAPARSSGWAIAASVALLLSLVGNALLYNNWQQANGELVALQNDNARIAAATQANYRQQLGAMQEQNAILRNDEFRAVALAGTKAAPAAKARVLYNLATKAVYVDVKNLPALPADKQYQLWALDNGKPVDAGTLAVGTAAGDSLQHMKDIASAQAFAMTVEPAGGSVNPTLSTMTVMGAI